ncbi:uncharacterized protein A1O9_13087 [Exophiala aquamarina CBS 119918]|uniref:DUF1996 domain-containing protein n=1 Tax=Exophiala aquamarina CBS 119918 TaxID=1182545 RepID=A0A072NV00_9EURO|nr:uncharacterized protein A1O9_13087 [Exophiala aquamarina CBS 119918]KEF50858.1 hypothetical protein A1O9_13087 [Exophiala aquamarina CBS 119918]
MYFQHQNGSFTAVAAPGGLTVYYKLEKRVGALDQSYAMFPQGLRMVAGRSEKRAWNGPFPVPPRSQWSEADMTQESLAEKAIGFNCLHYDAGWNEGTFNVSYLREKAFVDAYCVDGLRAEILFPSCWDGVHLDAPDHRSHVLYPDHLESGLCPPSHPIYFPIISYEVVWGTPDFRHAAGQFVMSNGDPTGFGYHGDFMAAWEEGRLDLAAADSTCTDQDVANPATDGDVHKCSSFVVQRDEDARSCKLHVSQPVQTDPVEGLLLSLPGNVSVTGVRHDPWPR